MILLKRILYVNSTIKKGFRRCAFDAAFQHTSLAYIIAITRNDYRFDSQAAVQFVLRILK